MSEQTQPYTAAEFLNDIPFGLAEQAHSGTSHVPERRAETERSSYAAHIAEFYNAIMAIAGDERRAEALADLERYRTGYADRYRTMLARRSRCVSTMIAGPSNFPKRQQEKRWASADNAVRDLLEWSERVRTKIYRKYTGTDVIRTGDAGAVEALEKKITTLEDKQEYMFQSSPDPKAGCNVGSSTAPKAVTWNGWAKRCRWKNSSILSASTTRRASLPKRSPPNATTRRPPTSKRCRRR